MTRAAIYLRISQDATGEGLGVARQLEDCAALAESMDWEVAEVYQDNDISATSGKPRPAYNKLLADIQAGVIDAVVAWHADRLYRRMSDLEHLLNIVQAHNTQIATVKAGRIDLTTDSGQMIAEILASVASYEGRAKATRWKRSWRQGREAGKFAKTGTRLFGYTRDGEVKPDEAEIARRIVKDHLAGVSLMQIADELDRDGILATRDGPWRTGTLRQYLKNPAIAGLSTLKGVIVAEGTWEPLIDRETWEELQAILSARAKARPPRVALLGGLVFCESCDHRMISGSTNRPMSGSTSKRIYRCPNRPGMRGCGRVSIYAEPVEEIVEAFAKERLSDPRVLTNVAILRAGPDMGDLIGEVAATEQRIAELEAQLEQPGVPVQRLLVAIDRLRDRLTDAQSKLADAVKTRSTTAATANYAGGMEWPTELAARRDLVEVALSGRRVVIRAVSRVHNTFDPERVQIVEG